MSGDQSNPYVAKSDTFSISRASVESNMVFVTSQEGQPVEMLRLSRDGFFVRGVKVEQGPGEAQAVYEAFMAWMQTHCGYRK